MPDTILNQSEAPPSFRTRSAEIKELASALAKSQGAMENAKKDSENPAFKRDGKVSKYADLASVWDAIRKPLTDNGLCVIQSPRTVEGGVEIETELLHESGQFMRTVLWLPCPQMTVHTVGSTITYGRRYALMSVVGIAPEDDDGNTAAEAHKSGAPGTAGGGQDFRPPGPRRQSSWGEGGKQDVIADAQRDGLTANAKPKPLPAAPAGRTAEPIKTAGDAGNAIKRIEWVTASLAHIQSLKSKELLIDWWRENKERIDIIDGAMPTEHEKLIVAYDAAMDAATVRA
jgi:hypothetical protein